MMCDLITVMGEMASIVKNPTYWTGTLYARVMIVDRFDEQVLVEVFDFLQVRENEPGGFMKKKMALDKLGLKNSSIGWNELPMAFSLTCWTCWIDYYFAVFACHAYV